MPPHAIIAAVRRGCRILLVVGGVGAAVMAVVVVWLMAATVRPPSPRASIDAWDGGAGPQAGRSIFESCASCHLADGEGRPDGSIPRLAGQRSAIVARKLRRLARGEVDLPVMVGFARSLNDSDIDDVADFLEELPVPVQGTADPRGAELYAVCAACHGLSGEGNDGLGAPRLCGQHAPYLVRRMEESVANTRGDADPAMAAIVAAMAPADRAAIASFLASGACR